MQALAAFYYNFDSKEIMLVFENGLMTIANDDVTWVTFDRHYVHPKDATELINYRSTANWTEFDL